MEIIPLTADRCIDACVPWSDEFDALLGRLQWHVHTPYAHALVAHEWDDVIAVACAINHGSSGRITLMRTPASATFASRTKEDPDALHTTLANMLLAQLEAEGCESVSLVSAPADVERWSALGFVAHEQIMRYSGGRFLQATRDEVINFEPFHRMGLLHLDRQASGEDRSTLLMEHSYLGSVYMEGNRMRGFSLPLLGEGLIIADAPDVGLELQRWLFPIQQHILLPAGNLAHEHLTKQDYTATPVGVRMVRGTPLAVRTGMSFGEVWGAV